MEEKNKVIFQFNQNNNSYEIITSLTRDRLNIVIKDSYSQIFENSFNLPELMKISRHFLPTHTIEQIQSYLNSIIEKQMIGIKEGPDALSFILNLVNNDQISIPLLKKMNYDINNFPFVKYNSVTHQNQYKINPNQVIAKSQPVFYNKSSSNNIKFSSIPNPNPIITQSQPILYSKNSSNNIQFSPVSKQPMITQPKSVSPLGANQYPRANNMAQPNITSFSLDENKLANLEKENNLIKIGQEKLKNDIKRLIQEISKLKEENQVYKTDHDSLTNENALLKNENDNYKTQIELYQKENEALKQKLEAYNKDLDAVESQNDQIRKMYEELENEYNQYKSQTEEINKQNEILRVQIEELNNNFTMINQELENIRNENDVFKSNLEQQKKNLNEDMVNRLIQENHLLKKQLEENAYSKKQYQENQNQEQEQEQEQDQEQEQEQEQEREKEEVRDDGENQGEEEEEEKGEIIHNMKELELITNKINRENKKIIINLLYKASVDGDKASVFHSKCDNAKSSIVLVETLNGKRFGGYTTCSWSGNCEDKNDPNAFIFSLDKMETYDNIPGDEAIGCYPKFGPIFLGCQIKIFDNAFTKGGTTFEKELNFNTKEDYELTGGDRVFQIKEIEVYEVIIE